MATEEELSEVVMMQGSALDVMSPSRAQEMEVDLTNGSFEDDQLLAAQQQSLQMYQMQQMQQMQGYPAQYKDDNESEEDEDEDENEDDEDFSDDEDFDDAPSKKKRKTGAASENKAEVANKNETQASHARVKSSATPVAPKTPPRGARDKKTVSPSPQNSGKRGRKGESKSPPVAQRGQQAKLKEEDYEDDEENDEDEEEEEEEEDGEEYVEEGNDDEDEDEDGEEVDEEDVEVVQPDKAPVKSLPSATQIVATSQMSEESASDNEHTNTHTKAAADLREIPESKDDGSEGESEDEEEEEEKASKRKSASTKKTNRKAQDKDVTANQNAKDDNADEEDNNEDDDEEDDDEEEEEEEQTAEPENPLQGEIDSLDAASRKIYDYLKRTNRPFSPLDIQRALTGLTKLQVTKSLSKLVDLGIAHVNEKKVHWLEQTIFGSTDPSAISKTKARLEKRSESAQKPKRKLTALKRDIADLRTEPADDEVDAEIAKLRATLREHKTELAERNAGPSGKGETESRMANLRARAEVGQEVLECEFKFYKEAWRSRREVVQNFVQDILDNMAKKVKIDKFYDELGIESDAAFNLNIKDVRMRD